MLSNHLFIKFRAIFGLLGGIFGMIMVIGLPCMIYIRLGLINGKKWLDLDIMVTFCIGIVAGMAGFTGAVVS